MKSFAAQGEQNSVVRGSAKLVLHDSGAIYPRLKKGFTRLLEITELCQNSSKGEAHKQWANALMLSFMIPAVTLDWHVFDLAGGLSLQRPTHLASSAIHK